MKIFIIFFIFLLSCTPNKQVYVCGDHICSSKKEFNDFFKKNMSVEIMSKKSLFKKNTVDKNKNDLVLANINRGIQKDEINVKSKIVKTKNKLFKKEKAKFVKKSNSPVDKKKLDKKLIKKSEKKLKKTSKKENIAIKEIKDIFTRKKQPVKTNSNCEIISNCNIDEISTYVKNKTINKDYPDLTIK